MPSSPYSDLQPGELMRLAQGGDKTAYAALLRSLMPVLKGFVGRRLGNLSDIDDVVQDILLSIHRASHTYDTDRPFNMWMFSIARHRLSDHLRRHYRQKGLATAVLDEAAFEIPAPDVTNDRDQREFILNALASLPDKQRKIVTMMKLEGQSAEMTAKALNMSISAVKVSAHRAYKALALTLTQLDLKG